MNTFCTLDLKQHLDKKANYHTHTTRCKHASGTEREYIEKAIEAGYKVLGFSDHSPYIWDCEHVSKIRMDMSEFEGYVTTINNLKNEYRKDIFIYSGLEMEYFPGLFDKTIEVFKQYPLDYLIQGQHCFSTEVGYQYVARDWTEEIYLQTYFERIEAALKTGLFLYVAHPDIINFAGDKALFDEYLWKLARLLKQYDKPIEINVNGYRGNIHYPNRRMIEIGVQNGNEFIIGVDAHNPDEFLDSINYNGCVKLVTDLGGKLINFYDRISRYFLYLYINNRLDFSFPHAIL